MNFILLKYFNIFILLLLVSVQCKKKYKIETNLGNKYFHTVEKGQNETHLKSAR